MAVPRAEGAPLPRSFFARHALEVAPQLLGAFVTVSSSEGAVTLRITEVEAYHGVGVPGPYDAGSHSKDRRTERNASMFGPPGHAYVYFTYGMHYALNMVCSPEGVASGVLLRGAEVIAGAPLARKRRHNKRGDQSSFGGGTLRMEYLARGPGNLAAALGVTRAQHDGSDLLAEPFRVVAAPDAPVKVQRGPRVGVAGEAGGPAFPWRFWLAGEPSVSAFRPGRGAPRALLTSQKAPSD